MLRRHRVKKPKLRQQELQERLEKVEQVLEQLTDKNFQYTVNINQLHAHQPVLEQLTFRLDQLDVKTVSGALNLGNNFGVRIVQDEKKKNNAEKHAGDVQTSANPFNMNRTANGYNFTFRRSSP